MAKTETGQGRRPGGTWCPLRMNWQQSELHWFQCGLGQRGSQRGRQGLPGLKPHQTEKRRTQCFLTQFCNFPNTTLCAFVHFSYIAKGNSTPQRVILRLECDHPSRRIAAGSPVLAWASSGGRPRLPSKGAESPRQACPRGSLRRCCRLNLFPPGDRGSVKSAVEDGHTRRDGLKGGGGCNCRPSRQLQALLKWGR